MATIGRHVGRRIIPPNRRHATGSGNPLSLKGRGEGVRVSPGEGLTSTDGNGHIHVHVSRVRPRASAAPALAAFGMRWHVGCSVRGLVRRSMSDAFAPRSSHPSTAPLITATVPTAESGSRGSPAHDEDEVQGKVIITAAAVRTAGPGAVTSTGASPEPRQFRQGDDAKPALPERGQDPGQRLDRAPALGAGVVQDDDRAGLRVAQDESTGEPGPTHLGIERVDGTKGAPVTMSLERGQHAGVEPARSRAESPYRRKGGKNCVGFH